MNPELYAMLTAWLDGDDEPKRRHAEYRLGLPDAVGYVPPPYPSLLTQAASAVKAAAGFIASGFKVASNEEQDRRLAICHACELFDGVQGRCRKCGCFGDWKTWIASQQCPLWKWGTCAIAPPIDQWKIVTLTDLCQHTQELVKHLPPDVDLVAAVSRSGLVPGGIVASMLHLPLWTVTARHGLANPGHGGRLAPEFGDPHSILGEPEPRHVLVIDDTAAMGREMPGSCAFVHERWPGAKITRAVVYCHPQVLDEIDLCYAVYPGMHYLLWNFANAGHGQYAGWDFDGCLCENPRDDRKGMEPLPLYLPRRKEVALIISGRHQSSRQASMDWLAKHGVTARKMILRDFDLADDVSWERPVAEFKARHYKESDCVLFVESEPGQAEIIARLSGKPVFCAAAGRVFPGGQA
jgi:hypothetical protein